MHFQGRVYRPSFVITHRAASSYTVAMRVYFAGAILGGRENAAVFRHIVDTLQALGHTVPTTHVANPDVIHEERGLSPRAVYERDMAWLRESDALIADVSTPSLGVGFEIGEALHQGIPALCLHREGLSVSKMITGNPNPRLIVATYRDIPELDLHLEHFLAGLSARQ